MDKTIQQQSTATETNIRVFCEKQTPLLNELDTLAVSRKLEKNKDTISDIEIFKKRAKSKYITNGFILDLVDLNSPLKDSYWNTFHCVENLLYSHDEKKLTGKYCKNRWCLVCNRIRTGKLMNTYLAEFSKYDDLYFVTLTIRNVSEKRLPSALKHMQATWNKIRVDFKDKKIQFDGIRKNECTYSFKENTYHPHYHTVIQGKKQAGLLISKWLDIYNLGPAMYVNSLPEDLPFYAFNVSQDLRKCDDNTLKELFKYFTKIVKRDKSSSKDEYPIFIKPLDKMNQAYYGLKVFNPFGKFRNIKFDENIEDIQSERLEAQFDGNIWEWVHDQSDWVSEYGELLTSNNYHEKIKVIINK